MLRNVKNLSYELRTCMFHLKQASKYMNVIERLFVMPRLSLNDLSYTLGFGRTCQVNPSIRWVSKANQICRSLCFILIIIDIYPLILSCQI
jgi:hypothetical protein